MPADTGVAFPGLGALRVAGLTEVAYRLAGPTILVYALFLAVPNAFLIDGFVYVAMVHSLVEHGSLAFENGYATYGSEALDLHFFIPSDGGLMPQYPSGWAFVAAPFYAIGGVRGLFLLNALATVLTLWLIRITARTLFDDDRLGILAAVLYAFGTFAFDYAGAVWPHALTGACVAGGMAAAAMGWRRDAVGWFAVAGLVLGLAINFRADAVLAIPAIGVWILGAAARPWRGIGAFAVALVPGLLIAAAINQAKFGVFNPLSYGREGEAGATSLAFYARFLPLVVLGGLAAFSLGLGPVRRVAYRPAVALGLTGALLGMVALVPSLREIALRFLSGGAGLVIDMQMFAESVVQTGLTTDSDGVVRAHDWIKKALLQSMPYAAAVLLVLPALFRGPHRAGIALCLLVALAILFPFAYIGWWGGRAAHMRYLLHLAPALVILSALALRRIGEAPRGPLALAVIFGAGVPLAGWAFGAMRGHEPLFILQNSIPNALVLAIAALCLLAMALGGPARAAAFSALKGTAWAGVVAAGISAWALDFAIHQGFRLKNYALTEHIRALPDHALFHVLYPTWAFERIGEPETLIASPLDGEHLYDPALIEQAMAEGRAVFVQHPEVAKQIVEAGLAGSAELSFGGEEAFFQLFRLTPP